MALKDAAQKHGAKIIEAQLQFPDPDPQQCLEAVKANLSAHTKLAVFNHVTSKSALILPIKEITHICQWILPVPGRSKNAEAKTPI